MVELVYPKDIYNITHVRVASVYIASERKEKKRKKNRKRKEKYSDID